jgi:hypothetical protein
VYGTRDQPTWSSVVPDDDGASWYFGPPRLIGYAAPGSSRVELIAAPALTATVSRAAIDHAAPPGHRAFLAITDLPRAFLVSALTRVDVALADRAVTARVLRTDGDLYPSSLVEVRPGVHVAIAGNRVDRGLLEQVWRIEGDRVEAVTPTPDDPATEVVEGPIPETGGFCAKLRRPSDGPRAAFGRRLDSLRGLAASQGIAWAVGCSGQMYRITAVNSPPRVERHAYARYPELSYPLLGGNDLSVYSFSSVTALCPDHALLATEETTTNALSSASRIWELGPRGGQGRTREDADVRVTLIGNEATEGIANKGGVIDVIPRRGSPLMVMGTDDPRHLPGTLIELTGGRARFFAAIPEAGERLADGRVVVTFAGGMVLTSTGPQ